MAQRLSHKVLKNCFYSIYRSGCMFKWIILIVILWLANSYLNFICGSDQWFLSEIEYYFYCSCVFPFIGMAKELTVYYLNN